MKFKLLFLTLTIVLITGCTTSSKISTPTKQIKKLHVKKESQIVDNTPIWILNPNKKNHICAIGSAKLSSDKETMEKIASMKSKANISKQIKIYIDSKSKSIKNGNGNSIYTTSSTQQSTNMLRDLKVVDNYTDKENKKYYIRTCSKI